MATTEIYTLSLHDALPISASEVEVEAADGDVLAVREVMARRVRMRADVQRNAHVAERQVRAGVHVGVDRPQDRKSTRLNSSHRCISCAVFCLKKKKKSVHKHTVGIRHDIESNKTTERTERQHNKLDVR